MAIEVALEGVVMHECKIWVVLMVGPCVVVVLRFKVTNVVSVLRYKRRDTLDQSCTATHPHKCRQRVILI